MAMPPTAVVCRRLMALTAILAGVLLLAAVIVQLSGYEIARHITRLGLGAYDETLARYTVENLVRAAGVFGVAALLFGFGRPRVGRDRPALWLLALLALVLALDLTTVARRYVRPIDVQPSYASKVVTDTAVARGGVGASIANYVPTRDASGADWFANSLLWYGLRSALAVDAGTNAAPVLQALAQRPETFWRATHARFVVAPWRAAAPLLKRQVLEPLVAFSLGQGTVRQVPPSPDASVLAEFGGALPAAYVVSGWQTATNEAAQLQAMILPDWDPARTTVCDAAGRTGAESRVIGQARISQRRGWDFRMTTTVDVDTPQAGLLVLDEKYADDLVARIDGRESPVHRANALWAAVEVAAGHHEVAVRRRLHTGPVLLSGGLGALVAVWGLARLLGGRRRKDAPKT